jgi:hypothetical protein
VPLHATKAMASRPMGENRMQTVKKGERVKLRIVINVMSDGPYEGIPSYFIHRVPNPVAGRQYRVPIPCLEEDFPGTCTRIVLQDGTTLHSYDRQQQPVAVVYNYTTQRLEVLEVNWSMYRTIMSCRDMPEYGNPRGYDFWLEAKSKSLNDGGQQTERVLTAVPPTAWSAEMIAWVEQQLPAVEGSMAPIIQPEEIIAFLGARLVAPGMTPPPSGPGTVSPPPPIGGAAPPPGAGPGWGDGQPDGSYAPPPGYTPPTPAAAPAEAAPAAPGPWGPPAGTPPPTGSTVPAPPPPTGSGGIAPGLAAPAAAPPPPPAPTPAATAPGSTPAGW